MIKMCFSDKSITSIIINTLITTSSVKRTCGLIPRPSYKSVKSCDQNFEIPRISEFNCDDAGSSDTGEYRQMESCEMDLNSNDSDGGSVVDTNSTLLRRAIVGDPIDDNDD